MRIRAHNREFLDSINDNLGTALGFKRRKGQLLSRQPAILVFVPLKVNPKWIPESQLIPEKLEGPDGLWCMLDVVQGGKAEYGKEVPEAADELVEKLRGWDDQVWCGSQVSHWVNEAIGKYSLGTLGAFARKRSDGTLGFLTNQHVGIEPGKKLFHPVPWGTHLGTTEKVIEYVEDQEWYGPWVDEPNAFVRADCAFVRLASNFNQADINPQMMGVGQLGPVKNISLDDMSIIGQRVLRVGRTTGLRRGTIVAFGYEFYDERDACVYTDLLIVGDDGVPFSTHGDSGSLIVMDTPQLNPVGLLWGGWQEKLRTGYAQENWTYGIALSRVMDALEIDLVSTL
ncbi:hypothetical protein EO95_08920 [Methanosarcina sp. 1.H.T.1A.1]|uniref:hypothetical protein n=1 Tax=Methanosarcina sp. 1.H.T.1A.1 TaxID=1483602 RepID=UPI00062283DE|nr:hypothetical protein [Methanosarcina sp. 1.H.T.1A.1]KKH95439.1 hypothetical protein EO95_08920 [Methanosarcina sp. 1.H.T.1A.1]